MLFLFVYGDFCIIYQAFQLFAPETFYKNTVSVKASVFVWKWPIYGYMDLF